MPTPQRTPQHAASGTPVDGSQNGLGKDVKHDLSAVEHSGAVQTVGGFWTKVSNDWLTNLAGLLAYNFLMSIFPILLVLLAIGGFILNSLSPSAYHSLVRQMGTAIPNGATIITAVTQQLNKSAGLVFIIGIVTAIFTGSRLFITIENCFGVVFRLRGRDLIRQNIMAIGMLLIYIVLIPFVFLASIIPTLLNRIVQVGALGGFVNYVIGIAVGFLVGALLFGLIYVVVPNRPVHLREVWRGTLVAAGLLVVYEVVFPIYEGLFLKPSNYGSLAGFAIVILTFFYYLAIILLLGAEINSWASGQRQTAGDIDAIIHEVQAHNTTRGAAGPTAGTKSEDLQSGKGVAAMSTPARAVAHERVDHDTDIEPPKYAEVGEKGHGPTEAEPKTPASARETKQVIQEVNHSKGPEPGSLPPASQATKGKATNTAVSTQQADEVYSDSDDDEDHSGGTTISGPRGAGQGATVSYPATTANPRARTVRMLNLRLLAAFGAWVIEKARSRTSHDRHHATT